MSGIGGRIRDARKAKGWSRAKLMQACGWTSADSRIGNYELGYNEPNLEDIEKMSAALGVNLVSAAPLPVFETKTDLDPRDVGEIDADVVDICLSAGAGAQAPEFIETRYKHTFSNAWRIKKGVKQGEQLYRVQVKGNSMHPVLGDGDMVLVRPSDRVIVDMSTYAIVVAEQLKVKKLVKRRDGGLEIISCNKSYDTEVVPAEELDSVYVIGRVIDKSGDSGLDG